MMVREKNTIYRALEVLKKLIGQEIFKSPLKFKLQQWINWQSFAKDVGVWKAT